MIEETLSQADDSSFPDEVAAVSAAPEVCLVVVYQFARALKVAAVQFA